MFFYTKVVFLFITLSFFFFSCNKVDTILSTVITDSTEISVNKADSVIWSRFVSNYNLMYEFTGLDGKVIYPTSLDCIKGIPNALGWGGQIDDGAMLTGLYMDGLVLRWQNKHNPQDSIKIKKLVSGLLLLSSVSNVKGFVARGVSSDGQTHYGLGSEDQEGPWFYGLWRYLESNLPNDAERQIVSNKLVTFANELVNNNWNIPAEFFKYWGSFNDIDFRVTRRLFIDRICYQITKDSVWLNRYQTDIYQKVGSSNLPRIAIIESGLASQISSSSTWNNSPSIACLRVLWELEPDSIIKSKYAKGLEISAINALQSLSNYMKFSNLDTTTIDIDWTKLNNMWYSQTNPTMVRNLAYSQLNTFQIANPRVLKEIDYMREPIFAAWVISMAPNSDMLKLRVPILKQVIKRYDYSKMYDNWFFPVEATWWRIKNL